MYSSDSGGDRLLMFGSSSSIASIAAAAASAAAAAGEMGIGSGSRPRLNCPRCDSLNTKFCYYNNYNLSQPRHFCKACRRYWTKGGILRNVPVGGASRRSGSSAGSTSSAASKRSSDNSPSTLSSSKASRRHFMLQQDGEPIMAYPGAHWAAESPTNWAESPTSSSSDASAFCMNGVDPVHGFNPAHPRLCLSEESCSGGADLISTSAAGAPVSPPRPFAPTTTVVVDGPSVDDLMMAAELFPYNMGVNSADPFEAINPRVENVSLDVEGGLGGTMEFVDQTVPLQQEGDRSLDAVVNGCYGEREEVNSHREDDLPLKEPVAPDAGVEVDAAVTFNYVDNWRDLPHVPLVSDNDIYYDYDLLAFGVSIQGGGGVCGAVDSQQQQYQQQQQHDQQQQQLNLEEEPHPCVGESLWDSTSYYCNHWTGIDIDQSLLDLL